MTIREDQAVQQSLTGEANSYAAVSMAEQHDHDEHEHGFNWLEALRITFVAVAAGAVWFGIWEPIRSFSLIGVVGLLVDRL